MGQLKTTHVRTYSLGNDSASIPSPLRLAFTSSGSGLEILEGRIMGRSLVSHTRKYPVLCVNVGLFTLIRMVY